MCDIDRYSTGVLLVQISAGLLASVFFAKVSEKSAEEELPLAEAVDVPEARAVGVNIEEGMAAPPAVSRVGLYAQQLRRRPILETRDRSDSNPGYRTIEMSAREVQSVRFNF